MTQSGIVTFLFIDLIRSTEHLQRLGDEAGQRLFSSRHQLMTRAATAHGGEELEYGRTAEPAERELLDTSGPILVRIAPALRARFASLREPVALDKEEERFRPFDAITRLLIDIAQQRPLVLVLDDLHWTDRGTVAMLTHVARFVPEHAILLVGAYRDAEVDRAHPLAGALAVIRRLCNFDSLALRELAGEDVT